MTGIILSGCNGKMGRAVTLCVDGMQDYEIVCGIDIYTETPNSYPVYSSPMLIPQEIAEKANVIIDFSNASAVPELLAYCVEKQVPCVLCTTGLSVELTEEVSKASEKVAMLKSANMSLGINLLMKLAVYLIKKGYTKKKGKNINESDQKAI